MSVTLARMDRAEEQADELLVSHGSGKLSLAELQSRFWNDPHGFFAVVLGVTLGWEPLDRIATCVRDHALTAVHGAVSCGKDYTAALVALWWVYCRGGLVVLSAPTEHQAFTVMMGTIQRLFARNPDLPGSIYTSRLDVPGSDGAGILTVIGSRVSNATGFHHPHFLAIVSEAQGVPSHIFEAALSNASSETSRVLVVGNPLFAVGEFWQVCHSPEWAVVHLDALQHPNVVAEREVIPGAVSRVGIDRIASMFGVGSGQYVARVRGLFPASGAPDALVTREWLAKAHEHHADPKWWHRPEDARAHPVLGVDVARGGPDDTLAALRIGSRVQSIAVVPPSDTVGTADALIKLCYSYGMDPMRQEWMRVARGVGIVVDAVGVGAGVYDTLVARKMATTAFIGSGSPQYAVKETVNARADAYWGLRKLCEESRLALPPDELLAEELLATRWHVDGAGKIAIELKDNLRKRLHPQRSPDRADAVAIACWGLWRSGGSGVRTFKWGGSPLSIAHDLATDQG